jgi:hypothetical protein
MKDGGKGATPRPLGVPMEQFDRNFEAIFGKKPEEKHEQKETKVREDSD